jgi:hypothetical protein
VIGLLALAAAAGATPAQAEREQAYAACPGQDVLKRAANVRWNDRLTTLIEAHRTLRTKLKAAVPEGSSRILWYANGGDLVTATFSVIAVRNAQGRWHVSAVGQTQAWLPDAKAVPMPPIDRDLSEPEGRSLDRLIDDPCLYVGPTFLRDPDLVGGVVSTMEVETPHRRWIGSWWGLPTAQEKSVIDVIGAQ